ncbi:MAG: hypothetical protein DWQ40_04465 [Actinobacteria bacterium]|nr:MAG: hypothetical protein DWQ40_04465 [Actinomycetota bacterium]
MDPKATAFASEAISSVGRGDVPSARTSIAQACDIDRAFFRLADAIYLACSELERDGEVTTATWNTLGDAVGSGELLAVVEASRTA